MCIYVDNTGTKTESNGRTNGQKASAKSAKSSEMEIIGQEEMGKPKTGKSDSLCMFS